MAPCWKSCFFHLVCFFVNFSHVDGFIEGLYCGKENCYEVLEVGRDVEKREITKAYRKLAKVWHPDMHQSKEDKKNAEEKFRRIANAYEILRDEESRRDYDYMLDNPDEYYSHYFYYYRHRVAPKVDVRIVIAVTITIISLIQYWSQWGNYNTAVAYFITVPKYRLSAMEIAKREGLLDTTKRRGKDRKTKEELREEEEAVLKKVIQDKMDIRGGYSPPSILNVLWLQLLLLPFYLLRYIWWNITWIWKFSICKQEYGEEEKEYIMRKFMKLSQGQWDTIEEREREKLYSQKLWIKENFLEWKRKKDEDMKAELADNPRYKAYRRYMKKGGAGQMSFGPE